jgi:hypothetical protein
VYCIEITNLTFVWSLTVLFLDYTFLSIFSRFFANNFRVIVMQAGRALGDLKSVRELYDFKTLVVLFLIGSVVVVPTILKRKRTYE